MIQDEPLAPQFKVTTSLPGGTKKVFVAQGASEAAVRVNLETLGHVVDRLDPVADHEREPWPSVAPHPDGRQFSAMTDGHGMMNNMVIAYGADADSVRMRLEALSYKVHWIV